MFDILTAALEEAKKISVDATKGVMLVALTCLKEGSLDYSQKSELWMNWAKWLNGK